MRSIPRYSLYAAAVLAALLLRSPALALIAGAIGALFTGDADKAHPSHHANPLMKLAVAMLGFGVPAGLIAKVGLASIGTTFVGIVLTASAGLILGRLFGLDQKLRVLLAGGTAICGGSAIAAISPAIGASRRDTGVALAAVFLLNGVGIILFPIIGHALKMSQGDFGVWCALAIHDTAGVVGATSAFGNEALEVGTVMKLVRALWIIPVAYLAGRFAGSTSSPSKPYFLGGFLLAALLGGVLPPTIAHNLANIGKATMIAALFLLGTGLSLAEIRRAGIRSMLCATTLWALVATTTLTATLSNLIKIPIPPKPPTPTEQKCQKVRPDPFDSCSALHPGRSDFQGKAQFSLPRFAAMRLSRCHSGA